MTYTEASKRAQMKYMAKLKEIRFRVKPEEAEAYEDAYKAAGYPSMRAFIIAAITEKIERIKKGQQKKAGE